MRLACLLLVAAIAATAFSQSQNTPGGGSTVAMPGGYGYGGWYGGGHSSTLEEGIQHGAADIVRSQGMANLMNSQAAQGFEQARREYLDNRLKATQTYLEQQREFAAARQAQRATPLSHEQYVRLARELAPDPLTTSQLDVLTGAIGWPAPLRKPQYEAQRKKLDKLFQDRAAGYAEALPIKTACDEFIAQLKDDIMNFTPGDFIVAKKFLDSLAYAARAVPS